MTCGIGLAGQIKHRQIVLRRDLDGKRAVNCGASSARDSIGHAISQRLGQCRFVAVMHIAETACINIGLGKYRAGSDDGLKAAVGITVELQLPLA